MKIFKESYGSVYYKERSNGTKFNLILNDDKFIIKYFYKFTNIIKKEQKFLLQKSNIFPYGQFFVYHYF